MDCNGRCLSWSFRYLVVRYLLISILILISASWCTFAQEADTLIAAEVVSVRTRLVVRPIESINLSSHPVASSQVTDIIRHFTGVQVKDYGGVGGLKTVNVRSLGSEHVGIFLDGIQIDNAQNMQVDLGRFSTDDLESLSLFNGQKTHRLQTAKEYASGSAIHLTSEHPRLISRKAFRGRLRTGSFGTINPSIRWEKALSSSVSLRSSAEFITSTGKYKYPYFDTTLVRENSDIRSLRLESQLFGRLKDGYWQLHAYTYGSERGFPGPVIRRSMGFPFSAERQADQDIFLQGAWNQNWSERFASSLRFKYSYNYTHYDTHPEKNPMAMPYDLHYKQQSGYLSFAQSYIINNPWSIDLSTDIQYNSLASDVGQFVSPERTTFTGALASRGVWEKFRIAAHLVYIGAWDTFNNADAGGWSRKNTYRDTWMPSINLYYSPAHWLEMSTFAKQSYRLPSFNDLYYSQMGNASLIPESAFQIGSDFRFFFSNNSWSSVIRISPYYNNISNKIVAIPTSSQFRWAMLNIGKVDITGIDTKAEFSYHHSEWFISTVLRYSFQQALDHSSPSSQTFGNQIPYIPLHSGSFALEAYWHKWIATWDTTFTGERWSRTANTSDYHIAPWSITDISISFTPSQSFKVCFSCNNIFNCHYQIVQGYPMPGFNAMLSLEFNW